jgi:hypothetical protein
MNVSIESEIGGKYEDSAKSFILLGTGKEVGIEITIRIVR